MGLKDIKIPKADVKVTEDSSFAVRGLSTFDIEHLVRSHGPQLRELFDGFMKMDKANTSLLDLGPLIKDVVIQAPALVVDIIATAADADDEERGILRKLPVSILIDALGTIAGMTLNTEGDMGKAMETALKLLGGVNGGLAEMLKNVASR